MDDFPTKNFQAGREAALLNEVRKQQPQALQHGRRCQPLNLEWWWWGI